MDGKVQKSCRTIRACDACKRRKVRCDGREFCHQCKAHGLECVYHAPRKGRPKTLAGRGAIIAACRANVDLDDGVESSTVPTSDKSVIAQPPVSPSESECPSDEYFLDMLPEYSISVYQTHPVISELEVRECIGRMRTDPEAMSFMYAFAAMTKQMVYTEWRSNPDLGEEIQTLVRKAIECRGPPIWQYKPTVLKAVTNLFLQNCLRGLEMKDLAFIYLRESISVIQMLRIDHAGIMATLSPIQRAQRQRLYWVCFIHERFTSLSFFLPVVLPPLPEMPDPDPNIDPTLEQGWNCLVRMFLLVDKEFVDFWNGDRSQVTAEWIEKKHRQLDGETWQVDIYSLPEMQKADLIVNRQWLRTLTWQMAISNTLLSSKPTSDALSIELPLQLSRELRHFISNASHHSINIHGPSMFNKLFEITDTIASVVIHLPGPSSDDIKRQIEDALFLKEFIFSCSRTEPLHREILTQKFDRIAELFPHISQQVV